MALMALRSQWIPMNPVIAVIMRAKVEDSTVIILSTEEIIVMIVADGTVVIGVEEMIEVKEDVRTDDLFI
jgi:hypothetical protein